MIFAVCFARCRMKLLMKYLGARPYLTPIGVYGDIVLNTYDCARLSDVSHRCRLLPFSRSAELSVCAETEGQAEGCTVRFSLFSPDGGLKATWENACDGGRAESAVLVESPQLWWPRPYGAHPLYRLQTELLQDGTVLDLRSQNVGIREIKRVGDFQFTVNGTPIRLWGSNVAPFQAVSHRWDPARALKVLSLARDANMNALRIWGEGVPYGEELYDFCDREGILLIHDLFSEYGYWPDDRAYRELCLADTEYLIRRIRGHACLLMWFGNNEAYMFGESEEGGKREIGFSTFFLDFARLCETLDPGRFYSPSSPYGGRFANDALEGDTHSYNGAYHVPGLQYPVFFSEDCYTTALPMHSMRRFMTEEEIFPKDYVNLLPYGAKNPAYEVNRHKYGFRYWRNLQVPETWHRYLDEYAQCEYWGAERYYDAVDAETLVYRFSACAADYFKSTVERVRCGIPTENGTGLRRTQGHLNWKLNDAFPMISFTLIDAFLEPAQPYYSIKRAYSPVLLSIEIGDHIRLWGVNDTPEDVEGLLEFRAFSKFDNAVRESFSMPVRLAAGESRIFTTLDFLGAIRRDCVLFCELKGADGKVIARNVEHFDMERDTLFPEAKLSLRLEGGELVVETDQYAHCVILTGDAQGDAFGWDFSDNYFHLLPFETKRVQFGGGHRTGTITAKPFYSPHATTVTLPEAPEKKENP